MGLFSRKAPTHVIAVRYERPNELGDIAETAGRIKKASDYIIEDGGCELRVGIGLCSKPTQLHYRWCVSSADPAAAQEALRLLIAHAGMPDYVDKPTRIAEPVLREHNMGLKSRFFAGGAVYKHVVPEYHK